MNQGLKPSPTCGDRGSWDHVFSLEQISRMDDQFLRSPGNSTITALKEFEARKITCMCGKISWWERIHSKKEEGR
jgi:hypothetical protein